MISDSVIPNFGRARIEQEIFEHDSALSKIHREHIRLAVRFEECKSIGRLIASRSHKLQRRPGVCLRNGNARSRSTVFSQFVFAVFSLGSVVVQLLDGAPIF
jgi:hypothetical protein